MADEFITSRWTSWDDEVGCAISEIIDNCKNEVDFSYTKFEKTILDAENVKKHSIVYHSQKSAIRALEVKE